jgi:hypothetical protein
MHIYILLLVSFLTEYPVLREQVRKLLCWVVCDQDFSLDSVPYLLWPCASHLISKDLVYSSEKMRTFILIGIRYFCISWNISIFQSCDTKEERVSCYSNNFENHYSVTSKDKKQWEAEGYAKTRRLFNPAHDGWTKYWRGSSFQNWFSPEEFRVRGQYTV